MFTNPDAQALRALLTPPKTIAVVGLSPKPNRDSYRVAAAMQAFGYRVIPIHPAVSEILGEQAYSSLSALPDELRAQVDIVNVFRAPEFVAPLVDECLRLGLKALWLQLDVVDEDAAARAQAAGMQVVMDRCIYVDYQRLFQQ